MSTILGQPICETCDRTLSAHINGYCPPDYTSSFVYLGQPIPVRIVRDPITDTEIERLLSMHYAQVLASIEGRAMWRALLDLAT